MKRVKGGEVVHPSRNTDAHLQNDLNGYPKSVKIAKLPRVNQEHGSTSKAEHRPRGVRIHGGRLRGEAASGVNSLLAAAQSARLADSSAFRRGEVGVGKLDTSRFGCCF